MPRARGPVIVGWIGLPALQADLKSLPRELITAAAPILAVWGRKTAAEIAAAYPVGQYRGNRVGGILRARVRSSLEFGYGEFGVRAKVWSGAPHAHLYERGTKPRWTKKRGTWYRGVSPKGGRAGVPVLVPAMIRARAAMRPVLVELLQSFGLTVRDDG